MVRVEVVCSRRQECEFECEGVRVGMRVRNEVVTGEVLVAVMVNMKVRSTLQHVVATSGAAIDPLPRSVSPRPPSQEGQRCAASPPQGESVLVVGTRAVVDATTPSSASASSTLNQS